MSNIKKKLYTELEIKNEVSIYGISVNPIIFKNLDLGGKYQEQIHALFEMDHEQHSGVAFPCSFTSPNGLRYSFNWDRRSNYSVEYKKGQYFLYKKGMVRVGKNYLRNLDN